MQIIDNILNKLTMYRIILYGLLFISFYAVLLSYLGILNLEPQLLIFSLVVIILSCFIFNKIFSLIFKISYNTESFLITSLILFLILTPINSINSFIAYLLVGFIAMASKYLLVINKKHIFNPAALALVVIGILGLSLGEWWVANKFIFPAVLIIGLLVARKTRKLSMVTTFLVTSICIVYLNSSSFNNNFLNIVFQVLSSWPVLFLGFFMLTEPLTSPPTRRLQLVYGLLVGIFSGMQFSIGPIYFTSEFALVIGNVFSYFVGFKKRLTPVLLEKRLIGADLYEFIFDKKTIFNFKPGQYFEWTLPHKNPDSRGNRRFFTIASSPTEDNLKIGIRVDSNKSSSFKKTLLSMKTGEMIYAGNLAGDFILPINEKRKIIFIAGGIGITPFRSMIKYMLDKKIFLDIFLFYSNKNKDEILYKDIFDKAKKELGIKVVYVLTDKNLIDKNWKGESGRLSKDMLTKYITDFKNCIYFLSGPWEMIENYDNLLKKNGVSFKNIHKDYFSGYA